MSQRKIETERLAIRPFTLDDLPTIHRIKSVAFGDPAAVDDANALQAKHSWLEWPILTPNVPDRVPSVAKD